MSQRTITIYHSPDADDAFMFYGFVSGAVKHPDIEIRHELCDIESLNKKALTGELEVTAVSVHALAHLKDRYAILNYGASMGGEDYGPRVIGRDKQSLNDGRQRTIAVPGVYTSAALALGIYLKEHKIEAERIPVHFEEVMDKVKKGEVDAGVIIHEGQLTHSREGLHTLLDLGQWWWNETGLPLPLGINVVRKDLGPELMREVASMLRQSINYALANRHAALDYALSYGRGLSREDADTFVGMYVNERTVDLGADGLKSIQLFLERGATLQLVPRVEHLEVVH